jgi:predicted enzyme related to lactoylglutathione lyase
MDRVVHFEVPTDDLARAKEFYGSAFGWDLRDSDMGGGVIYTSVGTVPVNEQMMPTEPGAINGGLMRRTADTPAPVITIGVDSRRSRPVAAPRYSPAPRSRGWARSPTSRTPRAT